MYLLPPRIFPHEPLDTMDQRYFNFSHAPIVSPLKAPLDIEIYNDTFSPSNTKHFNRPPDSPSSCKIDELAFQDHTVIDTIPSSDKPFHNSSLSRPTIEEVTSAALDPIPSTVEFSAKLFFVQYTPKGTLRPQWYLVQVDMESTLEVNPSYATNNLYWYVFLACHPDDHKKAMN